MTLMLFDLTVRRGKFFCFFSIRFVELLFESRDEEKVPSFPSFVARH